MALTVMLTGCSGFGTQQDTPAEKKRFFFPYAQGVYYLRSYGSNDDLNPPSGFRKWILGEDAFDLNNRLNGPWGLDVTKGKVYVSDGRRLSGYWVLDLERNRLDLIRHRQLSGTLGMAIDSRGFKFLVGPRLKEAKAMSMAREEEQGSLLVFNTQDKLEQAVLLPGRPLDIAIGGDRLYITDAANHRVLIVDRHNLQVVGQFGKSGNGDSEFSLPKAIATDTSGRVYVGDTYNGRIKVFSPKGEFLSQYGYRSRMLGSFLNLNGLDVDHDGRVYAVDAGYFQKTVADEVQMFDGTKFYRKGTQVPSQEVKIDGKQRVNALLGYFQVPFGVGDPEDPLSVSQTYYRPLNVAIDYANIGYFQQDMPEDMHIVYLIWVSSEFAHSGQNLSVFAYAETK